MHIDTVALKRDIKIKLSTLSDVFSFNNDANVQVEFNATSSRFRLPCLWLTFSDLGRRSSGNSP